MSRNKPVTVIGAIHNNGQADLVLAELAEIERVINGYEQTLNEVIATKKKETEAICSPFIKRKQALENSLNAYAEYNQAELFKGRKTVELLFGRFGYRRSTALKPMPKVTWAKVLEKLKRMAICDAVRKKESVDKDELTNWSDERLAAVGVRRDAKEQFWYETEKQSIPAA